MPVPESPDASMPEKLRVTIKGEDINVAIDVSPAVANAMISLAMGGPVGVASGSTSTTSGSGRRTKGRRRREPGTTASPRSGKARPRSKGPGVINDLQLRPKGKTIFVDFASEKQPKSHFEKQAVILYWLQETGGMKGGITRDHVNTCYIAAEWPRPAELAANMQLGATRTKWFNTSDGENLTLTTVGEDMVRHKLPKKTKAAKS